MSGRSLAASSIQSHVLATLPALLCDPMLIWTRAIRIKPSSVCLTIYRTGAPGASVETDAKPVNTHAARLDRREDSLPIN